ncbi:DUF6227 family protein [Streptomyces sp. 6N223]|uniref:DUF6227 family protein n=1 Tax=Streptomyces sp. 6N223 TaxID=3457412 RepID=UPI003FD046C0
MSDQPGSWPEGHDPSVEELEALFALESAPRGGRPVARAAAEWCAAGGGRWPGRPEYPGLDAWEHARRLLRRAVNADRPGREVLRRLSRARAYDIERLPEPAGPLGSGGWCAIYEHAFLLEDDRELCLYELEHDLTPDSRLVCEVYADEESAASAARRHARALGA